MASEDKCSTYLNVQVYGHGHFGGLPFGGREIMKQAPASWAGIGGRDGVGGYILGSGVMGLGIMGERLCCILVLLVIGCHSI